MAESVMKMEISYKKAVDEEEQKKIDAVKRIIDEAFCTVGINKKENDMYIGNNDGKDYIAFGRFAIDMMKRRDVLSCIDTWLFYDEDGNIDDFGTKSKKDIGLLALDATDKSRYKEKKLSVMKMEIRYKPVTNKSDQQALDNLRAIIDMIFADCGFTKKEGDFYIGNNDKDDYAHFGMVFDKLNDWKIFLKSVDVWKFYDEYGNAEDFAVRSKKRVVYYE